MLLCRHALKIPQTCSILQAEVPFQVRRPNLRPLFFRYASNNPRNEQIRQTCNEVRVVNDQGKLSRPVPLSYVLASVERKTHFVQLVDEKERIVKIIDGRVVYAREKVQKKTAKKVRKSKEVQMAWSVSESDLMFKLKEIRRHLQKSHPVDVILAPKKDVPMPRPGERQNKLDRIVESLRDCAEEYQERTFEKGVSTVYLKGRSGSTES